MSKKILILIIINIILINIIQSCLDLTYAVDSGKIYYISSNGISNDGIDINNPMSLEKANTKKFNSNDKILFKRGDTFFGQISFNVNSQKGREVVISSYGNGNIPIISGAKILNKKSGWILYDEKNSIYRIDLTDFKNFDGIKTNDSNSCNIGFLEDDQGNKYYNRKQFLENLNTNFDFYCDNIQYLYIKSEINPYDKIGTLKASTRIDLVRLSSNIKISSLRICYTGAHGIVKKDNLIDNVLIENCIIENIGGSVQVINNFTKYGNGIEFWNQASNIVVNNNIIREIYDAGFTIQGNTTNTGFENIQCYQNVIQACTYPIEIFCRNKNNENIEIGIKKCEIYNNYIINQGRGWGYQARPDKDSAALLVLWTLEGPNKSLNLYNNINYNSKRMVYSYQQRITPDLFKKSIVSDYNKIFLNTDTNLVNNEGSYNNKNILKEYGVETNSHFEVINDKSNDYNEIIKLAEKSDDISKIKTAILYNTGIIKKNGSIIIKYYDLDINKQIIQEQKIEGLKYGTYGVSSREFRGYKIVGNNSCIITVDENNNSAEIVFKYRSEKSNNNNSDVNMWTNGAFANEDNIKLIDEKNNELKLTNEIKNQIETIKSSQGENSENKNIDNTIINDILPNTGKEFAFDLIIILIILLCVFSGNGYYKIKKQTYKQM